ncbi:Di-or tripeptidase [Parasphingorhabdus marina DSM 22363]|uniref:Di-or tripeptidase n=1 Tax=Parasphingorhabdus marina DSM 22363 TaxID=1123272 RepID=A0A1N6CY10_9SPHN|nr:M20/M25/M40 family metallo-hydrolase [Parasphingorhabdus marina]SIN63356.1 Di-or tripeptidase [Parasphingorhabdus marina DSM 22363]
MKIVQAVILTLLAGLPELSGFSIVSAHARGVDGPVKVDTAGAEQVIGKLSQDPRVRSAFRSIEVMDAYNVERLIALTEIPAPPFKEVARAKKLVEGLRAAGLENAQLDAVGNAVARRPGRSGDRTIAVVAHIDTVFPEETDVTVRREGNIYHAPGIGDNTRGLIVLLTLAEIMEKHALSTDADILFVGSVGEEGLGDLRGVRHLFRDGGPEIDSFIAVDGGSPDRLVTEAVGSNRYRVTFSGPGGHSYGAFGRAHPHQALGDAITRFTQAGREISAKGTKSTFSIGRIGGGTSINSIPFSSWMEVDMRSADVTKLEELDTAFHKAMNEALDSENRRRAGNAALNLDIRSVGKRPAGSSSEGSNLFHHASAAMRHLGVEPRVSASSTDANIPLSLDIPAVTMNRGGISRNAHAPNESWENRDAHVAIQILLLTLLAEAGR